MTIEQWEAFARGLKPIEGSENYRYGPATEDLRNAIEKIGKKSLGQNEFESAMRKLIERYRSDPCED